MPFAQTACLDLGRIWVTLFNTKHRLKGEHLRLQTAAGNVVILMQANVLVLLHTGIVLEIRVRVGVTWKTAIAQQVHYPLELLQGVWLFVDLWDLMFTSLLDLQLV